MRLALNLFVVVPLSVVEIVVVVVVVVESSMCFPQSLLFVVGVRIVQVIGMCF